jgi:PEP-CTERM motif
MRLIRFLTVAAFLFVVAAPSYADSIVGASSGIFVNPIPSGGPIVTSGVGTNAFLWGDPDGFGTGANSLTFAGKSINTTTETPFTVGTLTYFNGTTAVGSTPTSIDLQVTLNLTTPLATGAFTFTLNLVSTPNTGTDKDNADYVYFPSSIPAETFVLGSTTYNLQLLGFGNIVDPNGFSTPQAFHVFEDTTASADLFGVVTTQVGGFPGAPEPASVTLLGIGIGGLAGYGWRKRKPAVTA